MNVCKHFHMSCSRMTTPPLKSCQRETEVPLHLPFARFDSIFFSSKSSIHHLTDPSQPRVVGGRLVRSCVSVWKRGASTVKHNWSLFNFSS